MRVNYLYTALVLDCWRVTIDRMDTESVTRYQDEA